MLKVRPSSTRARVADPCLTRWEECPAASSPRRIAVDRQTRPQARWTSTICSTYPIRCPHPTSTTSSTSMRRCWAPVSRHECASVRDRIDAPALVHTEQLVAQASNPVRRPLAALRKDTLGPLMMGWLGRNQPSRTWLRSPRPSMRRLVVQQGSRVRRLPHLPNLPSDEPVWSWRPAPWCRGCWDSCAPSC